MSDTETILLVASPVTLACVPGSGVGACGACGAAVWIAPSSREVLAGPRPVTLICLTCLRGLELPSIELAPLTPAQRVELLAYYRRPAAGEA